MPEVGIEGQQAQGRQGAVHRRRRARLAGGAVPRRRRRRHASASSTSTSSTSATCSGRSCTARRRRPLEARRRRRDRLQATQPARARSSTYEIALSSENALELFAPYDVDRRRHRQLPDALPGERRVRAARQAERLRQHLPLRGAGVGVRAPRTARATAASIPSRRRPGWCPSCAEGGVLGVLPGIIGTIQATEAIKLILGVGEPLVGRFLIYDALRMRFRELQAAEGSRLPGVRRRTRRSRR